jgi:hypothetical protein
LGELLACPPVFCHHPIHSERQSNRILRQTFFPPSHNHNPFRLWSALVTFRYSSSLLGGLGFSGAESFPSARSIYDGTHYPQLPYLHPPLLTIGSGRATISRLLLQSPISPVIGASSAKQRTSLSDQLCASPHPTYLPPPLSLYAIERIVLFDSSALHRATIR